MDVPCLLNIKSDLMLNVTMAVCDIPLTWKCAEKIVIVLSTAVEY